MPGANFFFFFPTWQFLFWIPCQLSFSAVALRPGPADLSKAKTDIGIVAPQVASGCSWMQRRGILPRAVDEMGDFPIQSIATAAVDTRHRHARVLV
jgi:hypothetical protein